MIAHLLIDHFHFLAGKQFNPIPVGQHVIRPEASKPLLARYLDDDTFEGFGFQGVFDLRQNCEVRKLMDAQTKEHRQGDIRYSCEFCELGLISSFRV